MPPTQQMQMYVKHGLAGGGIAIHGDPIPFLGKSFLRSDLFCRKKKLTDISGARLVQIVDRCNMAARNDQDMRRRLRVDIPKRHNVLRLINDIGCYLAAGKFAEQAICLDFVQFHPSGFCLFDNTPAKESV